MDIHEARSLYAEGANAAAGALSKAGAWWPKDQVESSAVSFGMALAWARRIPATEHPHWLCMTLPRLAGPAVSYVWAFPLARWRSRVHESRPATSGPQQLQEMHLA